MLPLTVSVLLLGGDPPDFAADVLPILSDHCFQCHGPDAGSRKAGLRVDSREEILMVVEPGDLDASALHERIVDTDPDWVMPPPEHGAPLDEREIDVLTAWIEAGAPWEEHWAYRPIESPPVPDAAAADPWAHDPLDALVLDELDAHGLTPSDPADPNVWLRRVTLDLTGLPPTLDEIERFEADLRDGDPRAARERVVDGLLASRARAEHRTRQWLDVARYADTNGYQNDFRRDQWPWRDWVLGAYGTNMPYDRFVTLQVAGDLVPEADAETTLGTGFQRNHRMVTEAGSIDEEWRVENVADRAETTSTAFLGLTLACARCHDHKYDALSQEDYYRFYAFFDSVDEKGVYQETRGNVPPLIELPTDAQLARLDELEAVEARLEGELAAAREGAGARHAAWLRERGGDRPALPAAALEFRCGGEIELAGASDAAPDLGRAVSFERDRPFTTSLWLRPENEGAVYARMADDDTYRGTDLVLVEGMRPAVHLIHLWRTDAIKVVAKEPLAAGQWHHLAVRYDGSSKASGVALFVDGRPVPTDVRVDSLTGTIATEEPLRIGTRRYAGDLAGAALDFRVHDRALTKGEVLRLTEERALREDGRDFFAAAFDDEIRGLERGLVEAAAEGTRIREREIATAMVLRDREEPRETRLLERGQYDRPVGEPLTPGVPAVLGGLPADSARDRLALARWLTDRDNPLVARVAVNRVWASFFGDGLAPTQEDLGVRGERPVHPRVLDLLAADLIASGWDLRALERRIALSATYAQSSAATGADLERDPGNRWLARGPRHRLDAEEVRDQALAASGLLAPRWGGPSVKPYQPSGLWKELAGGAGQGAYVPSTGDDLFRRSVYTYRKRTVPHPTLTTFDAPGFELCTVERGRTNTPLQALAVLNDDTYVEAARHLARRMLDASDEPAARMEAGMRLVLARAPTDEEVRILEQALTCHLLDLLRDPDAVVALLGVGATAPPMDQRTPEWAAYTLIASTLLNLDEALCPR